MPARSTSSSSNGRNRSYSKLIAIGGATEAESFEIQAKVRITDTEPVLAALKKPEIEILARAPLPRV